MPDPARSNSTALKITSPLDVVRQIFPDADYINAGYLLWNCTAYPFHPDVQHYRRQLLEYKLTVQEGRLACEFCGSPGVQMGVVTLCDSCGPFMAPRTYGTAETSRG